MIGALGSERGLSQSGRLPMGHDARSPPRTYSRTVSSSCGSVSVELFVVVGDAWGSFGGCKLDADLFVPPAFAV